MCTIFTDRNVTINASWNTDVYFWFNPLQAAPTAGLSITSMCALLWDNTGCPKIRRMSEFTLFRDEVPSRDCNEE